MPKYRVPVYATYRKVMIIEAADRFDAQMVADGYAEGSVLDEGEFEFYDHDERDEIEAKEIK